MKLYQPSVLMAILHPKKAASRNDPKADNSSFGFSSVFAREALI